MSNELGDLYGRFLGTPVRKARFGRSGEHFRVLKWEKTRDGVPIFVYASFNDSIPSRTSLVAVFNKEVDSIASELSWAQRTMELRDSEIRHGDTLNLKKPLWTSSKMRIFAILEPLGALADLLDPATFHSEGHVHILEAVPVFGSEVLLKNNSGIGALRDALESGDAYLDPERDAIA